MAVMPKNEETQQEPRPQVRLFRLLIDQYASALAMGMPDTAQTFLRTLGLVINYELGEKPFVASFTLDGETLRLAMQRAQASYDSFDAGSNAPNPIRERATADKDPETPVLGKVTSADLFDRIKQLLPGLKPASASELKIPASALNQFEEVVASLKQAAEALSTVSRQVSVSPSGGLLFSPALSLAERMGLDLGTTTKKQWDCLQTFAKGDVVDQSGDKKTLESLADRVYFGIGDLVFEFAGFDGNTYIIQEIDGDKVKIKPTGDVCRQKGDESVKTVHSAKLGFLRRAGEFSLMTIYELCGPPKRPSVNTNR